jgi:hypothetical protein
MKLYYIVFLCIHYSLYIKTESFIHHPIIKTGSGLFLKLPANLQKEKFNVTYLPQQIITVQKTPKKIRCPLAKKTSYLKYRFEASNSLQELELLVKKETLGTMKDLLPHATHTHFIHKVVRIYKKNEDNSTWTPIATIPEKDAFTVFAHAMVHSDGTIHF